MTGTSTAAPRRGSRTPPGPGGLPLLGQIVDFARDPLGLLPRLAREYGDVVSIPLGRTTMWLLSHPDDIEHVHLRSTREFDKGYGTDDPLLGNGLVTSEGDFWRQQRRMMQPAYHRHRIQEYGTVMVRLAEQMTARWHPGDTLDVHAEMMRVTLAIISETMFGAQVQDEVDVVARALDIAMAADTDTPELLGLPAWVPTPGRVRLRRAAADLDRIVLGMIADRRARGTGEGDGGDLLDMLLLARDENGSAMSDQQLRDEAMTIFLAGHETTSNALAYAFHLLSGHPEAHAAMTAEIDATVGAELVPDDVARLPYTTAVLKEAMRLYPPVWAVSRRARHDVEVGGYLVPAGTDLLMSQWVVHRDERFFDDPAEFRPERWLDGEDGLEGRLPRYAYFPFGGGPRQCIGNAFALMEGVLVLAAVSRRFALPVAPGYRLRLQPATTMRPRDGLPARVVAR